MALKVYRPTSPGRRGLVGPSFEEITRKKREKTLIAPQRKRAGRNNNGKITTRHRGGGAKRSLRIIDFKRNKTGVPGKVASIEYDPNRTANIALIHYVDGEKRYILAPQDLHVGDMIVSGEGSEIRVGNNMPMNLMPNGTMVHNLELIPGRGGQMARSAGNAAQLMGKDGKFVIVRLPSGEMRRINGKCSATIGQVGNPEHKNIKLGKAGRKRWMGFRPTVRGSAMNPTDHPHGGGEGRSPIGMAGPKSPWGKPTLGHTTRRKKVSDSMIINRRRKK